jgi:hypothetical protein
MGFGCGVAKRDFIQRYGLILINREKIHLNP